MGRSAITEGPSLRRERCQLPNWGLKAAAEVWRTTGGRVIPLAPSATAAEVLGLELGCRAENLHNLRHTHAPPRPDDPTIRGSSSNPATSSWSTKPGWPAPGTSTGSPTTPANAAPSSGCSVTPPRCTSVNAGGKLPLVAHDAGAVELTDLHRFTDPDEATATIGIREGQPDALDPYLSHDRVHYGSTDAMLEAA